MSIADGEYDIDLSQLLADTGSESSDSSFAIRYGFIPDSMDQAKPLRLYQTEKECLLQAFSNNNSKPIIFEGAPQRHRKTNNPALDSYYLSFNLNDEDDQKKSLVQLRRLNSTIRVSKSRNPSKWEDQITQWDKQEQLGELLALSIDSPRVEESPKKTKPNPVPKTTKDLKSQNVRSVDGKGKHIVEPAKELTLASKRPPTATPETKNDIISESDFEDLGLDENNNTDFPIIDLSDADEKKPEPKPQSKPQLQLQQSKPRGPGRPRGKKKDEPPKKELKPKKKELVSEDIDMDDDFKDLEDQLQEVLEEEEESNKESSISPDTSPDMDNDVSKQPQSTLENRTGNDFKNDNDNDDDDDDDDDDSDGERYRFAGGPIIINMGEDNNKKTPVYNRPFENSSLRKPMSLRDLYGADNDGKDDMSSSEAE